MRGVDHLELIGSATETGGMAQAGEGSLADSDIAGVFGIEIAEVAPAPQPQTPENKKKKTGTRKRPPSRRKSARSAGKPRRARSSTRK
jgi:hypothetical protein